MFLRNMRWALLWALVILVLCLIPGKELPSWSWVDLLSLDKFGHAAVFGLLTILSILGLRKQYDQPDLRSRAVQASLLFAIPYGGLLELIQGSALVGRSADPNDFIANTVGCVLGVVFLRSRIGRSLSASW